MCLTRLLFNFQFKKILKNINISKLDSLSGIEFEEFISNYFRYLGYKTSTTPVTGDNGIDIVAKKSGFSLGIQAKLYYKHNISNSAIQEAFSGKSYYKCDYALVITNWNFSKPAKKLANEIKVGLIDREVLSKLLDSKKSEAKKIVTKIILGY